MKMLFLFICLAVFSSQLFSQNAGLITNVDGRKSISLNGAWQIIIDPYETGYYSYRRLPDPNGYFKSAKPQSKSDKVEYNFDASETLNVPGDWNTQKEKLFLYEGTVWYKKSFDYNKKENTRLFLYVGAANYQSIIYINGEKVGEHIGGFTPFNFDITDKIKDGENIVVIKVDNKRLAEGVPTLNTDWWNYGGITRDVELIETSQTFIRDYFIQLKKGTTDQISGWIQLDGTNLNQEIHLQIPEAKIDKKITTDEKGFAEINIKANPILWAPENPKLYDVKIKTGDEEIKDMIGFRSIETRGSEIFLNGKKIFLKGISIHEEAPLRSARANSIYDSQKLLGMAQELGCNFVRLAHYPHNENMIREADKRGILVWSEIPVYWTIQWENNSSFENAANQLSEMVTRDKNRSSVILWSVGNETPRSEPRLAFMKKLTEKVRSLDPTRLVTAATEIHYIDPKTIMTDDPLGNYLDVLGCNEYIGWYDGLPTKADSIKWVSAYKKPLVISEFGGDAKYGYHADTSTIWSEEFQENLYVHSINMIKKIPTLQGMSPWILMDFRSPRRPLPGIQDFFNRKGLFSNLGEKKKAFYILKDFYNSDYIRSESGLIQH
jgi:beta-glucuronidase